jgi:hypothetical protein
MVFLSVRLFVPIWYIFWTKVNFAHTFNGDSPQDVMMDEIADLKADLGKRLAEPVAVSHKVNVCIMNMYALYLLQS